MGAARMKLERVLMPAGALFAGVTLFASSMQAAVAAPGRVFRDCQGCPEMVVVPAGRFQMGDTTASGGGEAGHAVIIARPFALGKYEVTFAEWDACVAEGGCNKRPEDAGWGRGRQPAIYISWDDAKRYVAWISKKTGHRYALPSEAIWEYAARGGAKTDYSWGNDIGRNLANCNGCGSRWDAKQAAPVGSFAANGFGLHDMHGNVWEWVEDCWHDTYAGAPIDGSAWLKSCGGNRRIIRGASWANGPRGVRATNRVRYAPVYRADYLGFRVFRSLE